MILIFFVNECTNKTMNALNYKLIAIEILKMSGEELEDMYEEDLPELLGIDKKEFDLLKKLQNTEELPNFDELPNLDYELLVASLLCLIDDEDEKVAKTKFFKNRETEYKNLKQKYLRKKN